MIEQIKSKSNQRKPAAIYVDLSQDRCQEYIRVKSRIKKQKTVIMFHFTKLLLVSSKKYIFNYIFHEKSYIEKQQYFLTLVH